MDIKENGEKIPWTWGDGKTNEESSENDEDIGPSFSNISDLLAFEKEVEIRRLEKYFGDKKEE